MARRVRLRTVLILVNVFVLLLPVAGIQVLRIYESALVRQTESELIAQGVALASFYRATLERLTQSPTTALGSPADFIEQHSVAPLTRVPVDATEPWQPRAAVLDLADSEILAPLADPNPGGGDADVLAMLVGETLTPVLRDVQRTTLAAIRIVDFRGVIVSSTATDHGLSLAGGREVDAGLTGQGSSQLRRRLLTGTPPALASISRGSGIRVFVSTPITHDGRILGAVLLSRTPANIVQALYGKRVLLLEALALLLVVVIAIGYLTSRTVLKPLSQLSANARQVAAGDAGALGRIRPAGTVEISQLAESIHAMGDSLERRADYLRNFTRHLSHEFKGPLAAISGAVEVLVDHGTGMRESERHGFLNNIHDDVAHLNRLTERLLDLANADLNARAAADTSTDLGQLLTELESIYPLSVVWADPPPVELRIDPDSLEAVLHQLLDNAVQHGGDDVTIRLEVARSPAGVTLHLSDSGAGVSSGNRDRIFQPFFTTARENGGTGLGLSIVASLLETFGGSIELLETPTGAGFEVCLPLALTTPRPTTAASR